MPKGQSGSLCNDFYGAMDKIDRINALEQSLLEFKEPYLYDVYESINVYLSYLRKKIHQNRLTLGLKTFSVNLMMRIH